MFVRWKKKMRQDGKNYMLTATLVENARADGKIRQRHILQLGSISTKQHSTWDTPAYNATQFWMHALDRMHFAEIAPEIQEKARVSLAHKVPLPSWDELRQARKSQLAFLQKYYKPEYAAKYKTWYHECGL